jgi:hypothetical protein
MVVLLEEFIRRVQEGSGGTQNCGCDPCCPEPTAGDGPWMVSVTWSEYGSAILRSNPETIGYSASDPGYNGVAFLPSATELTVIEANSDTGWYRVNTADGVEGWISELRTQYLRGTCLGHPFVDRDDGRDGSPPNAIAYARFIKDVHEKRGTDFANRCLAFVNACYNITKAPLRCPLMANPGLCGHSLSAIGAYRALEKCGKIRPITSPLPPGAIVFWDVSDLNAQWGHIAIVAEDGLEVISSSFIDNMELAETEWIYKPVFTKPSVEEIATWTDAATLGYTTAEIAFTPGTWGMGNHS